MTRALRCMAVLLVLLAGCSNSNSNSGLTPGTVLAQSGISNNSIGGSYGWTFSGNIGAAGVVTADVTGTGTLTAGGSASSGSLQGYFSETTINPTSGITSVCSGQVVGSYNIGTLGSGTASLSPVNSITLQSGPGPCPFTSTATFQIVVAGQGHTLVFSSNDGNNRLAMSAGSQ